MAVNKSPSDKPTKKRSSARTTTKPALVEQNGPKQATVHTLNVTEFEIRRRAYELYEARGRQDGFDWDDWIRAEAELLSRLKEGA